MKMATLALVSAGRLLFTRLILDIFHSYAFFGPTRPMSGMLILELRRTPTGGLYLFS